MNNPLLINVTPFKGLLTESKAKPGVFEVTGLMQRAGAKNQNGRIYKREILEEEVKNYIENFVKVGNAYGEAANQAIQAGGAMKAGVLPLCTIRFDDPMVSPTTCAAWTFWASVEFSDTCMVSRLNVCERRISSSSLSRLNILRDRSAIGENGPKYGKSPPSVNISSGHSVSGCSPWARMRSWPSMARQEVRSKCHVQSTLSPVSSVKLPENSA